MSATLLGKSATESSVQHTGSDGLLFRSGQAYGVSQTLTDGATISWDASLGQVAKVTLAGNRTLAAPTNLVADCFYTIEIIQDATGNRTLGWNAAFKWSNGSVPTLSTGANVRDYFTFRSNGTNLYEQGRSLNVA